MGDSGWLRKMAWPGERGLWAVGCGLVLQGLPQEKLPYLSGSDDPLMMHSSQQLHRAVVRVLMRHQVGKGF